MEWLDWNWIGWSGAKVVLFGYFTCFVMKLHRLAMEFSEWNSSDRVAEDWMVQIQGRLRIWLKSRLLIGPEPKILLSDWSRGPCENDQRGYPYDP